MRRDVPSAEGNQASRPGGPSHTQGLLEQEVCDPAAEQDGSLLQGYPLVTWASWAHRNTSLHNISVEA